MLKEFLRARYHDHIKPRYVAWRLRTARDVLQLEFHGAGIGFFAQMAACLHFFRHAEARGFTPVLRLSSPNYLDSARGDDWFDYYFARPSGAASPHGPGVLRIGNIKELPVFDRDLTLAEAHDLFFRHVRLLPDITAEVDAFCAAHHLGPQTLGVHFRGTDKVEEAVPPSHAAAFTAIEGLRAERPELRRLFIASDEAAFVANAASHFAGSPVAVYEDSVRSTDGTPVHLNGVAAGNYRMGRDALMNALILSRCGALVRSTSFLSAWASIFNPALQVTLLNVPFDHKLWYPEREIIKTARRAA